MAKIIFKSILIIGVLIRIYLQFITPSFNVDEVALGFNIKTRNITALLYPLDNFQSAPPLFLLTQKIFISLPFNIFWIKIKIFSFIVSVSIIILIYQLAKKIFCNQLFSILFLSLFCFSPFVVYNTLTVKQYGVDLLFLIIVYSQFINSRQPHGIYFLLWSLFSNIGLFFTVGYLFLLFVDIIKKDIKSLYKTKCYFNLRNMIIALGPLTYVLYFVWFMGQNGASELKIFMQEYWESSFIPLNISIIRYCMYFIHGVSIYFISSYSALGISILVISIFGILYHKSFIKMHLGNKFLIAGISIHVILNILQLYPLSDRLYLYLALPLYLLLIRSIDVICSNIPSNWLKSVLYSLITLLLLTYFTYLPYRENDVNSLLNFLAKNNTKKVVYSSRALKTINDFNNFTEGAFITGPDNRSVEFTSGSLYISRVHHKYGHKEKTAKEESHTTKLINSGMLKIIHKVDGYNIYEIQ